jgi:hypothetical protein
MLPNSGMPSCLLSAASPCWAQGSIRDCQNQHPHERGCANRYAADQFLHAIEILARRGLAPERPLRIAYRRMPNSVDPLSDGVWIGSVQDSRRRWPDFPSSSSSIPCSRLEGIHRYRFGNARKTQLWIREHHQVWEEFSVFSLRIRDQTPETSSPETPPPPRSCRRSSRRRLRRSGRSPFPGKQGSASRDQMPQPPPPPSLRRQRLSPNIQIKTKKFPRIRGVLGVERIRIPTRDGGFAAR